MSGGGGGERSFYNFSKHKSSNDSFTSINLCIYKKNPCTKICVFLYILIESPHHTNGRLSCCRRLKDLFAENENTRNVKIHHLAHFIVNTTKIVT